MAYFKPARDFAEANPVVKEWFETIAARKAKSTYENYLSKLRAYWIGHLSKRYGDINAWLEEVRDQVADRDVRTQNKWAKELESWELDIG